MQTNANDLMVLLVRPRMQSYGRRLARRYRDVVDADEVLSAVDMGLLHAVGRFDPRRGPFIVLAGIWVRREVMRLVGRELEWRKRCVTDEDVSEPATTEGPHEEAERRQIARLVDRDEHRIWRDHVADGCSLRELSRRTGLSLRQIQVRLARSRRRLTRLCRSRSGRRRDQERR